MLHVGSLAIGKYGHHHGGCLTGEEIKRVKTNNGIVFAFQRGSMACDCG